MNRNRMCIFEASLCVDSKYDCETWTIDSHIKWQQHHQNSRIVFESELFDRDKTEND